MAWVTTGTVLKNAGVKTGIPALMDIYKKKEQSVNNQNNYMGAFNPNTNSFYKLYESANQQAGDKLARRTSASTMANMNAMTGGYNSSFGAGAATQAGAAAAAPYYQKPIDMLQQLEQTYYNRQQDNLNRQERANEQRGIVNPYLGYNVNPEANQYSSNYMAEINRRMATPDTSDDYLIYDLEAGRANKIIGTPELLNKYGDIYKTQAARNAELNQNATIAGLTGMYNGKPTADQVYRDRAFNADQANADRNYDLNRRQTEASIANMYADNARQNAAAKSKSSGLTYKDYVTMGRDMLDKGNYNSETGKYSKMYDPIQVMDWALGLPLNSEEIASLLSDLGVPNMTKDQRDFVRTWTGR